jgi:hypothetical protein
MELVTETKLDFDQTVSDEDRFAVRRVVDKFAMAANSKQPELLEELIADSTVIEGFSDLPFMKQEFVAVVKRWSGQNRLMRFPKLKLAYSRYLYSLKGTYEEFLDNILVTEGTIELALVKSEDKFQFVKIVFYPRMRLTEE